MDPDVVEILPPVTSNTPNSMKPTEAIRHDLIDLDNDDDDNDCADLVIGDKVGKIDKGKAIATIHDDYGDHQNVELFDDVTDKSGSGDGHNADSSCDDDYSDLFLDDYTDVDQYALIQRHFDNVDIPPGIEVPIPWLAEYDIGSKNINNDSLSPWSHTMSGGYNSQVTGSSQSSLTLEPTNLETQASSAASHVFVDNFETKKLPNVSEVLYWGHFGNSKTANGAADSTVATISEEVRDEILRKFKNFKQFDTVEDTSDHYFLNASRSMKQNSLHCAKRIQEEWKSLEKDLPDSIFVRVYESNIDLLRAVIIGAEGTPYHDGLFFFDVYFPNCYPTIPPQVHYHSCGLRLNPNLYNCGKVCLSLLNTWSGDENERWLPGVSTILQVLVSIQGLILNSEPYYNEPGYARLIGSVEGAFNSLHYNEDAFILSLRTMVYIMRRPPKNFEDFVAGQFCSRAHDILGACKAYMDGAQVGCLAKGGVQDVDQSEQSCSNKFRTSLSAHVDILVREFTKIGAKDCDKVFPSSEEKSPLDGMYESAPIPDKIISEAQS